LNYGSERGKKWKLASI